jgi:SAM-dependent methyltransferase
MWEVIEHLPNPDDTLRQIYSVLRTGGRLALTTPDSGSLAAAVSGKRWLGWKKVPEHLYFFDKRNLVRLLERVGFTVLKTSYVPLYVDLDFALDRLAVVTGIPQLSQLGRRLGRRPVRLNPYYDLMIIAQRS